MGYLPPELGGVPDSEVGAPRDPRLDALAATLHLEWCERESAWRELGHSDVDDSGKAGARAAIETEEDYPFG